MAPFSKGLSGKTLQSCPYSLFNNDLKIQKSSFLALIAKFFGELFSLSLWRYVFEVELRCQRAAWK